MKFINQRWGVIFGPDSSGLAAFSCSRGGRRLQPHSDIISALCIYIYIYTYIHAYIYTCIYIYIYRERDIIL